MSEDIIREAFLYIGLDLKNITPDNYPEFRSDKILPIAWYLLFDEKDIKNRREVMADSMNFFEGEFYSNTDDQLAFKNFMDEPVAFETTIPKAQERLGKFKSVFQQLPYFWSYFRIIEVLEELLVTQINKIAEKSIEEATPVIETYHPDVIDSQVNTKRNMMEEEKDQFDISLDDLTAMANLNFGAPSKTSDSIEKGEFDESMLLDALSDFRESPKPKKVEVSEVKPNFDDPFDEDQILNAFADLENTGTDKDKFDTLIPENITDDSFIDAFADLESIDLSVSDPITEPENHEINKSKSKDTSDLTDNFLLDSLAAAFELDKKVEVPKKVEEVETSDTQSVMFITAKYDHLAIEGYGKNIITIFHRLENLYHHARREEGKVTRTMVDILQDIFRESLAEWRITGLLSEDFVQGDPSTLGTIMLGYPSAFNINSKKTFDLEYWTEKTLVKGDERLMYSLTKFPSEDLHGMIKNGDIVKVSKIIEKVLILTKSKYRPKYNKTTFNKKPSVSNIWGIRVLIPVGNKYTPASILCESPDINWTDSFYKKLDLPGVLNDWNVEYHVKFEEFSISDDYQIIFKRAKGKDEAFNGFLRWIRRHNSMYQNIYGIQGTINLLRDTIVQTREPFIGQIIFTILTNLSQLGFDSAIEVLNDEKVVSRLSWIYSTI